MKRERYWVTAGHALHGSFCSLALLGSLCPNLLSVCPVLMLSPPIAHPGVRAESMPMCTVGVVKNQSEYFLTK